MHTYYNLRNFPVFVAAHGNWNIWSNTDGTHCAAIPTPAAAADGCKATHFGDMAYALATLGERRPRCRL